MYVCIRNERDAISFANAAPSILLRRVLNVCPLVLVTFFFFCFIKSLLLLYIGTFKSAHLDASCRRRRRSFFSSPPRIYSPPRASSSRRGFRAAISIPKILLTKRPMRTQSTHGQRHGCRFAKRKEKRHKKEKKRTTIHRENRSFLDQCKRLSQLSNNKPIILLVVRFSVFTRPVTCVRQNSETFFILSIEGTLVSALLWWHAMCVHIL